MIKLDIAMEISRRAFEEGKARGVVNMCVAVTDVGGNIRLVHRADGQGIFGPDTALGKARAALGFNRTSLSLSKTFTDPCAVAALNGATGGRFLPLGGGVVVTDADANIVGAAAVSGGMPDVDEDIIAAAVESVGLKVLR